MKLRYELRDSHYDDNPSMRRAGRFSTMAGALRAWEQSYPPGRFYIWDRQVGARVAIGSNADPESMGR